MDASVGQMKKSGWRSDSGAGGDGKGAKKEKKKQHWVLAKEAGRRVNGSQKRKKRSRKNAEGGQEDEPRIKVVKTEREEAASLGKRTAAEQRDYVWQELKAVLDEGSAGEAPPVEAFVAGAHDGGGTFAESVKAALNECSATCWAEEIERTPLKSRNGRPRVIVVSGAAMRCVQLINELREATGAGAKDDKKKGKGTKDVPVIAKLWSKHMKVEEQKEFLSSHYCGIVVGTPARLGKLVSDKALSLKKVRLIVLDCAPNAKGQTIFNTMETRADLLAFLGSCCLPGLQKNKFRMALV